ncbi:MAG: alpha/beta hydrolase [Anaerolineae bacterium]
MSISVRWLMLACLVAAFTLLGFETVAAQTAPAACSSLPQPPANGYTVESFKDVRYAEGSADNLTSLDIYTPDRSGKRPVMIFIHGGGWTFGDKKHDGRKSAGFTRDGYVYITINYRLIPAVQFPENITDVAAAIAWTYRNVAEYGGDPNCLFVMGHSAGAHLAALVSTDEKYLKAESLDLRVLKGTVLLDGAGYDIAKNIESANPIERGIYETAFTTDPNVWREASPVNFVQAGVNTPPFLIIYAGARVESYEQALLLAEALNAANVTADLYHAQTKNHMTLNRDLGRVFDAPYEAILAFLKAQIKPAS